MICPSCARCLGDDPENKSMTNSLRKSKMEYKATHRVLLLGPGESGKSTFLKQMINQFKHGFPEEERLKFKVFVYQNVLQEVQKILRWSEKLDRCGFETRTDPEKNEEKMFLLKIESDSEITKEIAEKIKLFWKNDEGFMLTYENRQMYQLLDSTEYFLDKIDEIAEDNYIPTKEDVFRCRTVTTGIVELNIRVKNVDFCLIDVGGQRSQRKKWIHCFNGVTAVLFFAAVSEYDQYLYEENTELRMEETVNLFEDICSCNWFRDTNIILFLNKKDIFVEKIKRVPITKYFSDYKGDLKNPDEMLEHVKMHFMSRVKPRNTSIATYFTNATDSKNIDHVFNTVVNSLLSRGLFKGGFI